MVEMPIEVFVFWWFYSMERPRVARLNAVKSA